MSNAKRDFSEFKLTYQGRNASGTGSIGLPLGMQLGFDNLADLGIVCRPNWRLGAFIDSTSSDADWQVCCFVVSEKNHAIHLLR